MHDSLELSLTTTNYTCRACGFMQLARVCSVGYGTGLFAADNARRDAQSAVPMLLALAKCPRCGQRDAGVAAQNRRRRGVAIGAIGGIFAVFSGLLLLIPDVPFVVPLIGIALMAIGFVGLRKMLLMRYPTEITDEVRFSDLPQPTWNPVPEQESAAGWKWL